MMASESGKYDWSERTTLTVLDNPFEEGPPSPEKVSAIKAWLAENRPKSRLRFVKFYHATGKNLPILHEGLKPATESRRRSYQSRSGFVYLANTPERAKVFGDLGNQSRSDVYEVIVPVCHLLPDLDQLQNQRAVGENVGDSLAESIVYGGGACVKGRIEPCQIRKMETADIANRARRAVSQGSESSAVEERKITDSPEFKAWFGDSKIVDGEGKPLVVYHGSGKEFSEFSSSAGKTTGGGLSAYGFFFSPDPEVANRYVFDFHHGRQAVYPVYLKAEKPLVLSAVDFEKFQDIVGKLDRGEHLTELEDISLELIFDKAGIKGFSTEGGRHPMQSLKGHDFDSIIKQIGKGGAEPEIMVFSSTQIKSVYSTRDAFSAVRGENEAPESDESRGKQWRTRTSLIGSGPR